jgi:hypothetical protein
MDTETLRAKAFKSAMSRNMPLKTEISPKKSNFSVSNTIGENNVNSFFSAKNRKIYENANTLSI